LKFQNEKLKKNFENSAEFNSNYLSVPCDLNLDFFLVPKQWIDEILFVKTFNFTQHLLTICQNSIITLPQQTQLMGLLKDLQLFSRKQLKFYGKRTLEARDQEVLAYLEKKNFTVFYQKTDLDSMQRLADMSMKKLNQGLDNIQSEIVEESKYMVCLNQYITSMPAPMEMKIELDN